MSDEIDKKFQELLDRKAVAIADMELLSAGETVMVFIAVRTILDNDRGLLSICKLKDHVAKMGLDPKNMMVSFIGAWMTENSFAVTAPWKKVLRDYARGDIEPLVMQEILIDAGYPWDELAKF